MAKKLRVYELARELNLDNSEVIRELQHMGVPVTSHSNTVEDRLADTLRKRLRTEAVEVAAPPVEEVAAKEPVKQVAEAPSVAIPEVEEPKEQQPPPLAPAPEIETKPVEAEAEHKAPPKP